MAVFDFDFGAKAFPSGFVDVDHLEGGHRVDREGRGSDPHLVNDPVKKIRTGDPHQRRS